MGFLSSVADKIKSVAPAITGGALDITTNLLGGHSSAKKAKRAAAAQRNWEEQMSNTSHQREVEDLNAAGLNEILSANSGASTPTSAAATTPDMSDISDMSSAIKMALDYEINNRNTKIQENLSDSQKYLNAAMAEKAEAEKEQTQINSGLIKPQTVAKIAEINSATALNKAKEKTEKVERISKKGGKHGYPVGKLIDKIEKGAIGSNPLSIMINAAKKSKQYK